MSFPGRRIHCHSRFELDDPLQTAMSVRACSIEADAYLVNGQIWISHDRVDLRPQRTLIKLFLEPMAQAVSSNGGHLYKEPEEVFLLIDIKENPSGIYEALYRELSPFHWMISQYRGRLVEIRAITVLLSGERATSLLATQAERLAFIDGRLGDLEPTPTEKELIPLISMSWYELFSWKGEGAIPAEELSRLRFLASAAHGRGQKIRFWDSPETESAWKVLIQEGIDLVTTDHPKHLEQFMLQTGIGDASKISNEVSNEVSWAAKNVGLEPI